MMRFKKNLVMIRGKNFFYWEKNKKSGDAIVLLHGFPANHIGLLDFAHCFNEKYRIIIPDLPGCGQSALLPSHTVKNYADWLHSFLKSIAIRDAVIIGHSFGSRIALLHAMQYPETIKKSVLVTPVLRADSFIARIAVLYYKIADILPKHLQKAWVSNAFVKKLGDAIVFNSSDKKILQKMIKRDLKELKRVNQRVIIELFDEFYAIPLIPLGKKITVDSLVIASGKDKIATVASVEKLVSQFDNVSFEILENEGHFVPSENPSALANLIEKWLAN